jgi:predicted RNA-binding Zn-ribbon protein involved in translation (DUF1610 family)
MTTTRQFVEFRQHLGRRGYTLGSNVPTMYAMSDYIVRATCPGCGDVVLTTGDLGLQVDPDGSRFLFACPRCHEQVSRPVPAGVIGVLRSAGVAVMEPAAINADDMQAFLADFEPADCLDQLRRLGSGT